MVTVTVGAPTHPVSDRLYGVFLEDINFGADGGLNANMVNNYSFDGVYLDHHGLRVRGEERWRTLPDPLRFWIFDGVAARSCGTRIRGERGRSVNTDCPAPPLHDNSRYARLTMEGDSGRVENLGYNGGGEHADACAMAVAAGRRYEFSAYVRPVAGEFALQVSVVDRYGLPLSDVLEALPAPGADDPFARDGWRRVACTLTGAATDYGKLRIGVVRRGAGGAADGPVTLDLDCVSLMDADHWGRGDPKWRHGRLRRDLVEAIAALRPSFVRFPGGCIVEGVTPGNEYRWKDTVGALPARRQQYSMWAFRTADGSGYSQSYQIGFYEYFCLCEDLGARPLPTLFAGITCQSPYRDPRHIATDSAYFREAVVQDYLDLIDFANGDPETDAWARVRARMGHPEPFGLDMIGVGNENYGPDYVEKYDAICRAVHAKDPSMLCVMSAGLFPFRLPMRRAWEHARAVAAETSVAGDAAADGTGTVGTSGTGVVGAAEGRDASSAAAADGAAGSGTAAASGTAGTARVGARGSATGDAIVVDEHSYHAPEWFVRQAGRFDDYPRDGAGVCFGEYSANGYFAARPQTYETACRWRSALAEAAFLTGCERNSDVVRMTSYAPLLAHITGKGWEQNLIEFNPATVSPTVNYEVQRLFSANVGTTAYECAVTGEDGGAGRLFVCATGDEGSRRCVKIVNVGDSPVRVTLDVAPGLRALGSGSGRAPRLRVETLCGPPSAKRSLAYTGAPRGGVRHDVREYRLSSPHVHVAVPVPAYSVTLVVVD